MRVALTAQDYDRLVAFYQEALGLNPAHLWTNESGRALIYKLGSATLMHEPIVTPWKHRNARLQSPDDLQITLFQVLEPE